jgi:hypothetical protein
VEPVELVVVELVVVEPVELVVGILIEGVGKFELITYVVAPNKSAMSIKNSKMPIIIYMATKIFLNTFN